MLSAERFAMDSADKPPSRPRAPWWMYIVAASLLGNFALNIYVYLWGPEPPFSQYTFAREALVVEEVLPNSAGGQAGIQVGDRVLAIDGQRVRGLAQWDGIRINFEVGKAYRLQVERDGKPFEQVITLQERSWSQQAQYRRIAFVLNTASALLTLFVALLVAFTRPHDWVARIGALSIALLGSSGYFYGTSAIVRHLPIVVGALIWWPEVGFFIFPALFFAFCSIFPRKLFPSRWIWVANLPSFFSLWPISGFAYVTFLNPSFEFSSSDWVPRLGGSLLFAYVSAGLVALILNYRRLDDINQKRRIRVLVAGTLVGYLALAPYVVISTMRGSAQSGVGRVLFSWPALLLATALYQAFPLSWAYAILRHRLFDVRVILRQGVQYALARRLLISAAPALAGIFLFDLLLHGDQPILAVVRARGWMYAALGALAAIAYTQRQKWLEALDRRFFRERYNAQRLLREVMDDVRKAATLEQVAPRVVAQVEAALHAEFVALAVREPRDSQYGVLACSPAGQAPAAFPAESKLLALLRLLGKPIEVSLSESGWLKQQLPHEESAFLRQAHIDLLVPVAVVAGQKEALLALGAKRSEEPYSRDDQELLTGIAASLALLLERPVFPGRVSAAFGECPQCGICYDSGASQCSQEGAVLTPMNLPRMLADRYRLERRLGRGGMGTVYEVTHTALDRRVAAKLIRDDLVGSSEAAERFRREARAAASFAHPNVVTVHDFGLSGNRAFLVMELLQGVSLRYELRRQGKLPAARAREILRGVCAGVEAAHRRQMTHRDLKPENIFLARGESGESAKVLDFGLVKSLPTVSQETADTGAGVLLGTVLYMSPEQLRGEAPNPAWDLWALGVIAYEILTGKHPFAAESTAELHAAVLGGNLTPLAVHCPDAPPTWQEFFSRALAQHSENRPPSAQAFFSGLDTALSPER